MVLNRQLLAENTQLKTANRNLKAFNRQLREDKLALETKKVLQGTYVQLEQAHGMKMQLELDALQAAHQKIQHTHRTLKAQDQARAQDLAALTRQVTDLQIENQELKQRLLQSSTEEEEERSSLRSRSRSRRRRFHHSRSRSSSSFSDTSQNSYSSRHILRASDSLESTESFESGPDDYVSVNL